MSHQSALEMVCAGLLKAGLLKEVITSKGQTSKTYFDLSTPALVELNSGGVSASVVKAMGTPKNAPPRRGSHKFRTKERT